MSSGRLAIFGDAIAADPILLDPLDLEALLTQPGEGCPDSMGQPAQRFDDRFNGGALLALEQIDQYSLCSCSPPWVPAS